MARVAEELLHVQLGVAEGAACLLAGDADGLAQLLLAVHHAHATPATSAGSLDDDRVADFGGDAANRIELRRQCPIWPRHARDACFTHGALGGNLVAHAADAFGIGPDKGQAGGADGLAEGGIFRKKAIAWMHCLCARRLRSLQQRRGVQIALRRCGRADTQRQVGLLQVCRASISLGVDHDRLKA
ncbi:hypothetical protein D3C76_972200 [compost metagenome]